MSQREGPQPEVGGSVGDAVEAELDGVDDLVDHDVGEIEGGWRGWEKEEEWELEGESELDGESA